jgi:hypothetical protein
VQVLRKYRDRMSQAITVVEPVGRGACKCKEKQNRTLKRETCKGKESTERALRRH